MESQKPATRRESPFGAMLRTHRSASGMSQERLAASAEVSTRHLSYLETGRAAPSRQMVLLLASALELPLRERNALLEAAGFASAYRESALDAGGMRALDDAIARLLDKLEPYPAVVVDRHWNVLRQNRAAARLLPMFVPPDAPPELSTNLVTAVVDPRGARPYLVNWEEVVRAIVERSRLELAKDPPGSERRRMIDGLLARPEVQACMRNARTEAPPLPFLPVHVRRDGLEARFFTMLTSVGTPLDVTAEELRIETYFPADDATRALLETLAGAS